VASIHTQKNRTANTYRVLWRHHGRQRSLTFENLPAAERFKALLKDHGPDEALRIIELDEIARRVPTVTEWLHNHINNLTGVQAATPPGPGAHGMCGANAAAQALAFLR
jgi:integrase